MARKVAWLLVAVWCLYMAARIASFARQQAEPIGESIDDSGYSGSSD